MATTRMPELTLDLVCYGCGDAFDPKKFDTPRNTPAHDMCKPYGGLWTSPVVSRFGWIDYMNQESHQAHNEGGWWWNTAGRRSERFFLRFTGRVCVVENARTHARITWRDLWDAPYAPKAPDYEAMIANGVDAIWLTYWGLQATQYMCERKLNLWDVETVLILNPACIEQATSKKAKQCHKASRKTPTTTTGTSSSGSAKRTASATT